VHPELPEALDDRVHGLAGDVGDHHVPDRLQRGALDAGQVAHRPFGPEAGDHVVGEVIGDGQLQPQHLPSVPCRDAEAQPVE